MRGARVTFKVEEPTEDFARLAYWKHDLEYIKRAYARAVFHMVGSVSVTAEILGVNRSTLYGYLK